MYSFANESMVSISGCVGVLQVSGGVNVSVGCDEGEGEIVGWLGSTLVGVAGIAVCW